MLCFLMGLLSSVRAYQRDHVARLPPRLWPRPRSYAAEATESLTLCNFEFSFENNDEHVDSVRTAVDIYSDIILSSSTQACDETRKPLRSLRVILDPSNDDNTQLNPLHQAAVNEKYKLTTPSAATTVKNNSSTATSTATLTASTYQGLLRGLETFSQLIQPAGKVPAGVVIFDSPTFEYRGILVDVARNFIPLSSLKRTIDALMYSKMNRLHLHLSDSQSFPLQLETGHGPNITQHGAYSANETYSRSDIQSLVDYATSRGTFLLLLFFFFIQLLLLNLVHMYVCSCVLTSNVLLSGLFFPSPKSSFSLLQVSS